MKTLIGIGIILAGVVALIHTGPAQHIWHFLIDAGVIESKAISVLHLHLTRVEWGAFKGGRILLFILSATGDLAPAELLAGLVIGIGAYLWGVYPQ